MTLESSRPPLTVLVVDDAPANLNLLAGLLNTTYRVKLAPSGPKALEIINRSPPDLILLDVMMPDMDGYEVCRHIKQNPATHHIPVIFLTAIQDPESETKGLGLGASDFIHKPISPSIVQARVKTHLENKTLQDLLRQRNTQLSSELDQRLVQLDRLRDSTLYVMVSFAEFRDQDTGNHVKRTQEYVRVLATYLWQQGMYHDLLNEDSINLIAKSAPLHDLGKVAIPDNILLKPGKLTAEEFEIMKQHTLQGWEMLRRAALRMDDETDFLCFAMEIARSHHEKWDGSGYPDGLIGGKIPLSARLMAVADVYDALISQRPYKKPLSHEHARDFLLQGKGAHFDPDVVHAFEVTQQRFIEIAQLWRD